MGTEGCSQAPLAPAEAAEASEELCLRWAASDSAQRRPPLLSNLLYHLLLRSAGPRTESAALTRNTSGAARSPSYHSAAVHGN